MMSLVKTNYGYEFRTNESIRAFSKALDKKKIGYLSAPEHLMVYTNMEAKSFIALIMEHFHVDTLNADWGFAWNLETYAVEFVGVKRK